MAEENKAVIIFDNVSKDYFLYKNNKEKFKALFTGNRGVKKHPSLKNVSMTINRGESVGIIGKNGAGKSTILKMITQVAFPTKGQVTVKGKVAALLELTAGFSPELTGRENIYMKGYLLGLADKQISKIEETIIDFSELGEYIDQPIRSYSSGMKMRLGFAINISIRPDILVIDEALSVGDAAFKNKCEAKISELISDGVTVLFVSHTMKTVEEICSRTIYLEKGSVIFDGPVAEGVALYKKKNPPKKK